MNPERTGTLGLQLPGHSAQSIAWQTAHCLACKPQRQHQSSLYCLLPPAEVIRLIFSGLEHIEKSFHGELESCSCNLD